MYHIYTRGGAIHCGASVRELHGALVFQSTTFTGYSWRWRMRLLLCVMYASGRITTARQKMPGEEARVSNVCRNVAWVCAQR